MEVCGFYVKSAEKKTTCLQWPGFHFNKVPDNEFFPITDSEEDQNIHVSDYKRTSVKER